MIAPAVYGMADIGRYMPDRDGSGELGLEVRVEQIKRDDREVISARAWGVTAGIGLVQWGQGTRTIVPGAFYGELSYRSVKYWPLELGVGPAYYIDDPAAGAQLTVRCAVMMVRARYVANTGAEIFLGGEIPIPLFLSWSQ